MHNLHPKKIILWDLHEVVFTRNLCHWLYLFITYPHKWEIIRSLDWYILSLFFRYFLHVTHIKRAEITSQELVDYARKKHLTRLIELTILIASDYHPIKETVAILKTLHDQGYTQHIGSNIGPTVFDTFSTHYPTIFSYFTGAHFVHYKDGNLIKKPNPQFFIDYLKTYNLSPDSIIFIDDKPYNVAAAQEVGIDGIQFKNTNQLKQELIKRGILNQ